MSRCSCSSLACRPVQSYQTEGILPEFSEPKPLQSSNPRFRKINGSTTHTHSKKKYTHRPKMDRRLNSTHMRYKSMRALGSRAKTHTLPTQSSWPLFPSLRTAAWPHRWWIKLSMESSVLLSCFHSCKKIAILYRQPTRCLMEIHLMGALCEHPTKSTQEPQIPTT